VRPEAAGQDRPHRRPPEEVLNIAAGQRSMAGSCLTPRQALGPAGAWASGPAYLDAVVVNGVGDDLRPPGAVHVQPVLDLQMAKAWDWLTLSSEGTSASAWAWAWSSSWSAISLLAFRDDPAQVDGHPRQLHGLPAPRGSRHVGRRRPGDVARVPQPRPAAGGVLEGPEGLGATGGHPGQVGLQVLALPAGQRPREVVVGPVDTPPAHDATARWPPSAVSTGRVQPCARS
jgi:hypothetical protein